MSYVILGHAKEEDKAATVPPGCTLILAEECGIQGTFPHYLYPILSNPENAHFFNDPVKYKHELESLFKKPFAIYGSGETCPYISYNLVYTSENKETGEEHVYDAEPSGVYALPALKENWEYREKKGKGIGRYTHKIKNPIRYEDALQIYKGAVFPTIDSSVFPLSVAAFQSLSAVQVSQSELFARFPGVHFNFLCRSLPSVDAEIDAILSLFPDSSAMFTEDTFNRVGTVGAWLSDLNSRGLSLTSAQKEGIARLREIVAAVSERREAAAPQYGPTLLVNRRTDELLRLIQLGSPAASTIIAAESLEFLNRADSHNQYTPISVAAKEGNLALVKQLILRGVDLNHTDYDGVTPLMLACSYGHGPTALALLKGGSLPLVAAHDGVTAAHIAAGDESLVGVLGAILGYFSPNLADDEGDTPLHVAASNSALANLTLLLGRGADANIRNLDGKTALEEAIVSGCEPCAYIMIPVTDLSDRSALDLALRKRQEEVVIQILERERVPRLPKLLAFAERVKMGKLAEYIRKKIAITGLEGGLTKRRKTRRRRASSARRKFR